MSWDSVKQQVAKYAPLIAPLIGGPVGTVTSLVAQVLGADNESPDAIANALNTNPHAPSLLLELQERNRATYEQAALAADLEEFKQLHQTIRAELATDDRFKSYWRPAFGYAMVLTWCLTWVALCYVIIFETDKAQLVVNALANTTALWGIALAVLGVQITKRTQDKQVSAGKDPKGIIEGLATLIRKQ
jgi:hypothetical protein